jgi:hypothetical protein
LSISRSDSLQQLERLVASRHFRNSKRYPSLLRFVVEQTLAGNTEGLKERKLGISVFNKPNDYDTNADPIVRVTAGEIRKRIAQYYQEPGHDDELRIDIPLGCYVPQFLPPAHATHHATHVVALEYPGEPMVPLVNITSVLGREVVGARVIESTAPGRAARLGRSNKKFVFSFLCLIVTTAALMGTLLLHRSRDRGISYFWRSVVASNSPALIVIGVHSLDSSGLDMPTDTSTSSIRNDQESTLSSMIKSDMVPVSDIVSYSKITDLLTRKSHVYRTKGSIDTTLEDLRQGPVIFIGGLENVWTKRLVANLRYSFYAADRSESEIRDNKNPLVAWKFDNMQPSLANSRDYAIVASYFDPTIEQPVLIVAGLGKAGTVAASEFLTSNQHLSAWLTEAKVPNGKNIELVLTTEILDGQPGPPHVLASSIW